MGKESDVRGKAIAHEIIVEVAEDMLKNGMSKAVVANNMHLNSKEMGQIADKINNHKEVVPGCVNQ